MVSETMPAWRALYDAARPGPYWVTIRCPHLYAATVPIDPEMWARTPARAVIGTANLFDGTVHGGGSCAGCRQAYPLPDIAPLIQAALDQPDTAVYRSSEELTTERITA